MLEVVLRARRTREVQHRVDRALDMDELRDVVTLERERRIGEERLDVLDPPGEEVVEDHDLPATRHERPTDVGTDEPRTPRHHCSGRRAAQDLPTPS